MNIVSVRKQPEYAKAAIKYFQDKWASEESRMIYEDCIMNCITQNHRCRSGIFYMIRMRL